MNNNLQQQKPVAGKPYSNKVMWVVLVIILILVGVGIYWWWQRGETKSNENTVVNTTTIPSQNINSDANVNTSASGNTNEGTSTNNTSNVSVNAVDTSNWLTYTNSEFGYTLKYPSDWLAEEVISAEDPYGQDREPPFRTLSFRNSEESYLLSVYLKPSSEKGTPYTNAAPAGDTSEKVEIEVGGETVTAVKEIYQGKAKVLYFPSPGQVAKFNGFDFGMSTSSTVGRYVERDLLNDQSYHITLEILKSLEL